MVLEKWNLAHFMVGTMAKSVDLAEISNTSATTKDFLRWDSAIWWSLPQEPTAMGYSQDILQELLAHWCLKAFSALWNDCAKQLRNICMYSMTVSSCFYTTDEAKFLVCSNGIHISHIYKPHKSEPICGIGHCSFIIIMYKIYISNCLTFKRCQIFTFAKTPSATSDSWQAHWHREKTKHIFLQLPSVLHWFSLPWLSNQSTTYIKTTYSLTDHHDASYPLPSQTRYHTQVSRHHKKDILGKVNMDKAEKPESMHVVIRNIEWPRYTIPGLTRFSNGSALFDTIRR